VAVPRRASAAGRVTILERQTSDIERETRPRGRCSAPERRAVPAIPNVGTSHPCQRDTRGRRRARTKLGNRRAAQRRLKLCRIVVGLVASSLVALRLVGMANLSGLAGPGWRLGSPAVSRNRTTDEHGWQSLV
jgi:hypothetical protein